MRELLVVGVELLAYLAGTGVLAAAGVFAELTSVSYLSAGNTTFGVWLALMGTVALYAAYSVGTERLLPRLQNATR